MRKIVLIAVILLFGCYDAISCSCFGKGKITVEDFNSYDWIFVGTLIREMRPDKFDNQYSRTCIYRVIRSYKGPKAGDTVRVQDKEDVGACGLGRLTLGRNYLIYAAGDTSKWTSSCTRTTMVPIQFLPRDSSAVNSLKRLQGFGRIYDTAYTNYHADTLFLNKHFSKVSKRGIQKFYDENGSISAEGAYVNGTAEGFWNYYEKGKVSTKGKYVKGKQNGMWTEPFMDKAVYIREYKAGEFTYREQYFFDGKLRSKREPMGNGEKWVKHDYRENGKTRYIAYEKPPSRNENGKLEEGLWDGPFKHFSKAGTTLEEGKHEDGLNIGHWKNYYENGKLRMEGDYEKGKKTGIWRIYYPNKTIKAVGEYKKGEKTGIWKYYNEKGKEIPPNPKLIEKDEDWFTYSE